MKSFEEERRKAKMSPQEFADVQQPFDKQGKRNELFDKIYSKQKKQKEHLAEIDQQTELEKIEEQEWRKTNKDRDLHPKYI